MLRKVLVLLLFLAGSSATCFAQFYSTQHRPPNQDWQYLETPHFKIVFAEGNDSTAWQTGRILEEQYGLAQDLVGGELNDFPIVLNNYNDISNGFVTPIHFRSEIELSPFKGKSINPQTGNWLDHVVPHELVHALQYSHLGNKNIPQLVNIFSPDVARSFHGAIPLGVHEGIAVHHETEHVAPHGGRGNYPFFTNQFKAVFQSNSRWSMGQMVQTSAETRPFDRHYVGGYEFTAWLQSEYGDETTKKALDFYMDYPFLGYGVALRHVTGQWPDQLYDRFETANLQSASEGSNSTQITELHIPYKGREIRRPKWLSDSELIFYGLFYNRRPGFYRFDLTENKMDRLFATGSVDDYRYDLSKDRSKLIYSYYQTSPIYDNAYKAELTEYNFKTGQKRQLSHNGRLYAPDFSGDSLLAIQTATTSSKLVSVGDEGGQDITVTDILSLGDHQIRAVATNPVNQTIAVVVNKRGMQALWIADSNNLRQKMKGAPDISFHEGSVFDPSWHPNGNKLLFSSGFSGTFQLYEYDLEEDEIHQVTDDSFNAFEGSYSPDGDRIAYIRQVKNERLPAIIKRTNFLNKKINPETWQSSRSKMSIIQRPVVSDSTIAQSKKWQSDDYSSDTQWLKPRAVWPVIEEISNSGVYQFGFSLQSNNLLANQAYGADITYAEGRHWYDVTYLNKLFFPGFKIRYYSQPLYTSVSEDVLDQTVTHDLLRQRKDLAVSTPISVQLNENVYYTSLFIEPEIRRSQRRYFSLENNADTRFSNTLSTSLYAQFNYRLQQNTRDIQHNSGLILYSEVEQFLNSSSVNLNSIDINRTIEFDRSSGLTGGIFGYLAPFRRWNQSLRLGFRGMTQTDPVFDNQSLVSNAFSEPVLQDSNNLLSFNTRYTIPVTYVDDGGFLIPLYLSNIYLVAFSNTVTDATSFDLMEDSRSVFGLEIRACFRLSNLSFDLGMGIGYEPTRNNVNVFVGDF